MATYKITATYEYEGVVEAPTRERAEALFLHDLNMHYVGTDDFEQLLVCPSCYEEIESEDELNEDAQCDLCVVQAEIEEELVDA